jgi:predicted RNA-binding Zn ribbon-like protein
MPVAPSSATTFVQALDADLRATDIARIGGDLALDFVNTAEYRGTPKALEFLSSAQRLLAWCHHAGLFGEPELTRLARQLAKQPRDGQRLLASAVALRESLYSLFVNLTQQRAPHASALKPLNEALAEMTRHRLLHSAGGAVAWRWSAEAGAAAAVLGPPTLAAAQLLTAQPLDKLKQCPGCGWLFLDTSRNGLRRWCSMAYCGSTDKSRRQYKRRVEGVTTAGG